MAANKDEEAGKFERELREKILEEIRSVYTPAVVDHWQNPRNFRRLEAPDGYAENTGSCGDTMEMFLRVKGDVIFECAFQTDGCGTTIVCGSVATELAAGRRFNEALGIVSATRILKVLGGLPEENVHCARLAAETLRRAMADHLCRKNSPWKKNYQKT